MFMVIDKDKIVSYMVSVGTVALLFVMSFAITKNNNEILYTSVNATIENNIENGIENSIKSNNTLESEYNITGEK